MPHVTPERFISQKEALARLSRWEAIQEKVTHRVWHPRNVDKALDADLFHFTFDQLAAAANESPVLSGNVSAEQAAETNGTNGYYPMYGFISEVARSSICRAGSESGDTVLLERAADIATLLIERHCNRFHPFRLDPQNGYVSQGYEAFLRSQLRGITRSVSRMAKLESRDANPDEGASLTPSNCDSEMRDLIISALRASVGTDIDRWDLLHAMAYRGQSLRDFAKEKHCGRSWVSEGIATPLLRALRRELSIVEHTAINGSATIADVAEALGGVFPEDGFLRLVPRPLQRTRNYFRTPDGQRPVLIMKIEENQSDRGEAGRPAVGLTRGVEGSGR